MNSKQSGVFTDVMKMIIQNKSIEYKFNSMLLLSQEYPEFLGGWTSAGRDNFGGQLSLNMMGSSQLSSPQVGTILKEHFHPAAYPSPSISFNPFCPFCLNPVHPSHSFLLTFQKFFQKTFIAHKQCLAKQRSNCINTLWEEVRHAKMQVQSESSNKTNICKEFQQKISGDEYYIEMQIAHCLNNKRYFKLTNKVITQSPSHLHWNITKNDENSYHPNITAIPLTDFDLTLSYYNLNSSTTKHLNTTFVNLEEHLTNAKDRYLTIICQEVQLTVKIVVEEESKKQLREKMNYKYKWPQEMAMVWFVGVTVKMKAKEVEEDVWKQYSRQGNYFEGYGQNSSITQLLQQASSCYSQSYHSSVYKYPMTQSFKTSTNTPQNPSSPSFQHLPSPTHLLTSILTPSKSRQLQNYIMNQATERQLKQILQHLKGKFTQLVLHQYGNYTVQKLFQRLANQDKMLVLKEIAKEIITIAKRKEGTHTLQSFMSALTQQQQFSFIISQIQTSCLQLSTDIHATHFIQKIITIFPLTHLLPLLKDATTHILEYSTDKNAICVFKQMLKRIAHTENLNICWEIKNQILFGMEGQFDKIVKNAYGNYCVQFAYEFFGEKQCQGLTEIILDHFQQYSLHKYASNVIFKCLQSFWHCPSLPSKLYPILSSTQIFQFYSSKQANKILLFLLQRYQKTPLGHKISQQLADATISRYQYDRWKIALSGVRKDGINMRKNKVSNCSSSSYSSYSNSIQ